MGKALGASLYVLCTSIGIDCHCHHNDVISEVWRANAPRLGCGIQKIGALAWLCWLAVTLTEA
eukprot:scaffold637790_cov15-Prasinocladus_malaysianus.AAC.1